MHIPTNPRLQSAVASLLAFAAFAPAAHAVTLAEALQAYRNNHVADSERMLAEVAADPATSVEDRAGALRELGRIDGLIRGETDAIATAMAQTPGGEEACETAAVALRVHREANQPAQPLAYAEAAAPSCTQRMGQTLRVERARAHLALAAADATNRAQHLAAASAQLAGIDDAARGVPDVAGARFALAMARRDAAAAFAAWRDYYWLNDNDAPQALASYAGRAQAIFNSGLAASANDADALALIDMLIRAGFVADARQYANELDIAARAADDAAWRKAAAYFTFEDAVRAAALRANRDMASGGRGRSFERDVRAAMRELMRAAGLRGDQHAALAEAYGLYSTLGETSGYPSMHAGHLVQRERIGVSQYGRGGEVEFIVIDHMLSNGYESWLWDGWAEAGGWSSNGNTIVQVRSAYTDGPLNALRRTRAGAERDRFLADIARAANDERSALAGDGIAPLPATSDRLLLQAWEQIVARVGDDDAAFIAESWRASNQYSITSHEGRHALDNANERGLSTTDLEYRAKLSQIIFADYPRLGLANVADGAQGDTPHGNANRRLLEGYRAWMRAHSSEIVRFDTSLATLSQLDKLSDEQVVAIARSLDPWAQSTARAR